MSSASTTTCTTTSGLTTLESLLLSGSSSAGTNNSCSISLMYGVKQWIVLVRYLEQQLADDVQGLGPHEGDPTCRHPLRLPWRSVLNLVWIAHA